MTMENVAEQRLSELTVLIEDVRCMLGRFYVTDPVHSALREKLIELENERDQLISRLAFREGGF